MVLIQELAIQLTDAAKHALETRGVDPNIFLAEILQELVRQKNLAYPKDYKILPMPNDEGILLFIRGMEKSSWINNRLIRASHTVRERLGYEMFNDIEVTNRDRFPADYNDAAYDDYDDFETPPSSP